MPQLPSHGRRGRPPYPDILTPAEWRVLEHLRAERSNVEIAAALAISINTVRFHVSNMLAKLELADRHALGAWRPSDEGSARRLPGVGGAGGIGAMLSKVLKPLLVATATGATVVAVVAIIVLLRGSDGRSPEDVTAAVGFERVEAAQLRAAGLFDAGPLFEAPGSGEALLGVSNRADVAVGVLPPSGGVIRLRDGLSLQQPVFASGAILSLMVRDRRFTLSVQLTSTQAGARREMGSEIIAIEPVATRNGPVDVVVSVGNQDRRRYPVGLDTRGHIFVGLAPLPEDAVFDFGTGERLDVTDMRRLGRLPEQKGGTFFFSRCDDSQSCDVSFRHLNGPIAAPTGGILTFRPRGNLEIDAGAFQLRYEKARTGYSTAELPDADLPAPFPVTAGDEVIPAAHYLVSAWTPAGQPLSLVVADDGTLYVGELSRTAVCPCRQGS